MGMEGGVMAIDCRVGTAGHAFGLVAWLSRHILGSLRTT